MASRTISPAETEVMPTFSCRTWLSSLASWVVSWSIWALTWSRWEMRAAFCAAWSAERTMPGGDSRAMRVLSVRAASCREACWVRSAVMPVAIWSRTAVSWDTTVSWRSSR
ncbi:MAG: hypothetical protein E6J13_16720 [Chloroflexi bacterium]|nr:MAG: hypothetical protein E6J13_16720 [Chloroflexota bacterium]